MYILVLVVLVEVVVAVAVLEILVAVYALDVLAKGTRGTDGQKRAAVYALDVLAKGSVECDAAIMAAAAAKCLKPRLPQRLREFHCVCCHNAAIMAAAAAKHLKPLRDVGARAELVVLVAPDVPQGARALLERVGWRCHEVAPLQRLRWEKQSPARMKLYMQ